MNTIKIIWIAFSLVFLGLAGFSYWQSTQKFSHIANKGVVGSINGAQLGVKEFTEDFNLYIDKLNQGNRIVNIQNAIGFFVAFLTALVSFFIS